jgi:hypothetical protein
MGGSLLGRLTNDEQVSPRLDVRVSDPRNSIRQSAGNTIGHRGHSQQERDAESKLMSLVEHRQEIRGTGSKGGLKDAQEASTGDQPGHVLYCARAHGRSTPSETPFSSLRMNIGGLHLQDA